MVGEENPKEEVVEDTILLKDEETIINQDLSLAIHEIEALCNLALAYIKMTSGTILPSLKRIKSEIYAMLQISFIDDLTLLSQQGNDNMTLLLPPPTVQVPQPTTRSSGHTQSSNASRSNAGSAFNRNNNLCSDNRNRN